RRSSYEAPCWGSVKILRSMWTTLSRGGVHPFQVRRLPLATTTVESPYQTLYVETRLHRVVPPIRHLVVPPVDPHRPAGRVDPRKQPTALLALPLRNTPGAPPQPSLLPCVL